MIVNLPILQSSPTSLLLQIFFISINHNQNKNHRTPTFSRITAQALQSLPNCLLIATTIVNRCLKPGLSKLLNQSPLAVFLFPPTPHSLLWINLSKISRHHSITILFSKLSLDVLLFLYYLYSTHGSRN